MYWKGEVLGRKVLSLLVESINCISKLDFVIYR